jgi:tetratricopeptide (TPR) repeat protein
MSSLKNIFKESNIEDLIQCYKREFHLAEDLSSKGYIAYEIGRLYEERVQDLDQALEWYHESLNINSEQLASIKAARRLLELQGSWNGVIKLLESEIKLTSDPEEKASLFVRQGQIFESRLGDRKRAQKSYLTALELHPINSIALKSLEDLLYLEGDFKSLFDVYSKIANTVKDKKVKATLFIQMGIIKEVQIKDSEAALELYSIALENDPLNPKAFNALERLYKKHGRWVELISLLLRNAEGSEDKNIKAFSSYQIGRIYKEYLAQTDKAIAFFERGLKIDSTNILILRELTRLYEETRKWEELIQLWTKELELIQDEREKLAILHRIGTVFEERLGREEEAIKYYEEVLKNSPTYLPALQALGTLYSKHKLWSNLLKMHENEAINLEDPKRRAVAYYRCAELLERQMNQEEKAIEYYLRSTSLNPDFLPSKRALVKLYLKFERERELINLYESEIPFISDPKEKIALLHNIAILWEEKLGDLDKAAECYQQIIEISRDPLALKRLSRIYEELEKYSDLVEILKLYAEIIQDLRELVPVLHKIAEICEIRLQDPKQALKQYKEILKFSPNYTPALRALGRIYYQEGRWEKLIEMYEKEAEITTQPEEIAPLFFKAGEIYEEKLGQEQKAIQKYQYCLDICPGYQPALRALAQIYYKTQRWNDLIEILEMEAEIIEDPKQKAITFYKVGEIWETKLKKENMAIEIYSHILRIEPDYTPAIESLLQLYEQRQYWQELVTLGEYKLEKISDPLIKIRILSRLGQIWNERLLNPLKAIQCFEKILEIDPVNLSSLTSLEKLYLRLNLGEQLASVYNRLIKIIEEPKTKAIILDKLLELYSKGLFQLEDPLSIYLETFRLWQYDPILLEKLEQICIQKKDLDSLCTLYKTYLEEPKAKANPEVLISVQERLAEILIQKNQQKEAQELYQAILKKDPKNLSSLEGLKRIYSSTNNIDGLLQVLERLAELFQEPKIKASYLFDIGRLKIERLQDIEGGIENLFETVKIAPEDLELLSKIKDILKKYKLWEKLSQILAYVTTKISDPSKSVEIQKELAEIYYTKLNKISSSIEILTQILKHEPMSVPILNMLGELYLKKEEWNEAVAIYSRILAITKEKEIILSSYMKLADIWEKRIPDSKKAILVLEEALEQNKDDPKILKRLVNLYKSEADYSKAASSLDQIVKLEQKPLIKYEHLLELAKLADKAKDSEKAVSALKEAIKIKPDDFQAIKHLITILEEKGRWEEVISRLSKYLGEVKETSSKEAIEARRKLAEVLGERLNKFKEAMFHYQEILRYLPRDMKARNKLAEMLKYQKRFREAIREHQNLIKIYPFRLESFKELTNLMEELNDQEAASIIKEVLYYFKSLTVDEEKSFLENKKKLSSFPCGKLDNEEVYKIIHQDEPKELLEILSRLSPYIGKLYTSSLDSYGIKKEPPSEIKRLCDNVAKLLGGVDYSLWIVDQEFVCLEPTRPCTLLFPQDMVERAEKEQLFVIGASMFRIKVGTYLGANLSPDELRLLLVATLRMYDSKIGEDISGRKEIEEFSRRIRKLLPRSTRRSLEPLAMAYKDTILKTDYNKWSQAMRYSSDQVGLVICGDFGTAVDYIKKSSKELIGLPTDTVQEMIRSLSNSPFISNLLTFASQDIYIRLRKKLFSI